MLGLQNSNSSCFDADHFPLRHLVAVTLAALGVLSPSVVLSADCASGTASTECAGAYSSVGPVTGGNLGFGNGDSATNIYGGLSNLDGSASSNTVTMRGGQVDNDVFGSKSFGDATGNTVTISGGTVANSVYGGFSSMGNASGNVVHISGGNINSGGQSNKNITGGYGEGEVTRNKVLIEGGTVNGRIVGGISTGGNATNNTVSIWGAPAFGNDAILIGGKASSGDARTGNTLDIHTSGLTLKNIQNFQHLRFYLPERIAAGDAVLTLTDAAGVDISTPAGKAGTTIGVGLVGSSQPLVMGDSVTLIKATGGLITDSGLANTTQGMAGISRVYTFDLSTTADSLLATVSGGKASDEAIRKSPAEGQAAAAAMAVQGADLVAGQGMAQARQTAGAAPAGISGFGAMSGSDTRNNTGSHVDVHGVSLVAGLVSTVPVARGEALAGAFFETGSGNYSTFNETMDGRTIRGDGSSRYTGVGFLGRYGFADDMTPGMYLEGTVRIGHLKSDYRSGDLNPALGVASYDIGVAYWGAHVGVGKTWAWDNGTGLDMYGRYSWARSDGANVNLLGDDVSFSAVTSQRVRMGGRYDWTAMERIKPYVDLAWEYEFDGDARSVVAGEAVAAPSLKGSSGVGEIGVRFAPSSRLPLSMDVGVQGWVGQREGVSASLKVNYVY